MIHEENNMCGVHWVIYLFVFVCRKFTQDGQHNLLSPTRSREKATKGLGYDNYSLRQLRSKVVQTPGLTVIPSSTVWRIRHLKLHKNKRMMKLRGVVREWLPGNGINKNNLISVSIF